MVKAHNKYKRVLKVVALKSQKLPLRSTFCTSKSNNLLYFSLFFNKNTNTMRQFLLLECRFRTQFFDTFCVWGHLTLECSDFRDIPVDLWKKNFER